MIFIPMITFTLFSLMRYIPHYDVEISGETVFTIYAPVMLFVVNIAVYLIVDIFTGVSIILRIRSLF